MMFVDFDDIKWRYLQLYLMEYPENRSEDTRKAFLDKHINMIKADLLKQADFYAKRANQMEGGTSQKISDIEFLSINAFTELLKMLE